MIYPHYFLWVFEMKLFVYTKTAVKWCYQSCILAHWLYCLGQRGLEAVEQECYGRERQYSRSAGLCLALFIDFYPTSRRFVRSKHHKGNALFYLASTRENSDATQCSVNRDARKRSVPGHSHAISNKYWNENSYIGIRDFDANSQLIYMCPLWNRVKCCWLSFHPPQLPCCLFRFMMTNNFTDVNKRKLAQSWRHWRYYYWILQQRIDLRLGWNHNRFHQLECVCSCVSPGLWRKDMNVSYMHLFSLMRHYIET